MIAPVKYTVSIQQSSTDEAIIEIDSTTEFESLENTSSGTITYEVPTAMLKAFIDKLFTAAIPTYTIQSITVIPSKWDEITP